jgi:hypothetical protein
MSRGAVGWGLFFLLVGVLFLLGELDVFELRARYVWPVIVIAIGVAVILGGGRGGSTGDS